MGRGPFADLTALVDLTKVFARTPGRVGSPSLPTMSTPARRRLMRDFKRMQNDPPEGVNGAPQDNDIMKWHAVIFGCVPAHTCAPPSHARPIEAPRLDAPGALASLSCPVAVTPGHTACEEGRSP